MTAQTWPETLASLVLRRCGTNAGKLRSTLYGLVNRDLNGEKPEAREANELCIARLRERLREIELPLPERGS